VFLFCLVERFESDTENTLSVSVLIHESLSNHCPIVNSRVIFACCNNVLYFNYLRRLTTTHTEQTAQFDIENKIIYYDVVSVHDNSD